ncbi:MAG: hypothetical protein ACKV22_40355 [Bryobacteraceae bacterium]
MTAAVRLLSSALLVSFLYGLWANRLLDQPVWSPTGLTRLAWFCALYSAIGLPLLRWVPQHFARVLLGAAVLWSVWMAGWIPVAAAALFLAAAYVVGTYATRRFDWLALAAGIGVYSLATGALMFFPVNSPGLHLVLHLAPLLAGWRRLRIVLASTGAMDGPKWLSFAVGFVALAHLAAALKPEAGPDALTMHLALPAEVARQGFWHFDVARTAWAVMPMGANWTFTAVYLTGGEWACRLLNYAYFLILLALLWHTARIVGGEAGLAVLLFATTPLTQLVTASLFVENYWAVVILATFASAWQYRRTRAPEDLWLGAWFAGCSLAAKAGSVPLIVAIVLALQGRSLLKRIPAALAVLALAGSYPYLNAWWRTGNPIFPFANSFFRSPLFEARDLVDARFPGGLHWSTLSDLTFRSHRFVEGQDGALGFHWWFALPLAVLVRWTRGRWAAPLAVAGGLAAFAWQANLRYLYSVLPIASVMVALVLAGLRQRGVSSRAILSGSLVLAFLNFCFLPASGWLHKDFCLNPLDPNAAARYLEWAAPQRRLIEWLNRHAAGQTVVALSGNAVAGLDARAYTNSWHHPRFQAGLLAAESPEDIARLTGSLGALQAIAPPSVLPSPALREFVDRYTEQEFSFGGWSAFRILPAPVERPALVLAPGVHDDADRGFHYRGSWFTDTQFPEAAHGTITYTRQPNASVRFRFRGSMLTYVYTRAPNRGRVTLDVDGKTNQLIDLRAETVEWQRKHLITVGPGEHTATLSVTGDGFADIDGWVIEE